MRAKNVQNTAVKKLCQGADVGRQRDIATRSVPLEGTSILISGERSLRPAKKGGGIWKLYEVF